MGDSNHNDTTPVCVEVTISNRPTPVHTHTYGEWTEVPGTCTVKGYKTTRCTTCNAQIELHNGELDPNNQIGRASCRERV